MYNITLYKTYNIIQKVLINLEKIILKYISHCKLNNFSTLYLLYLSLSSSNL